MSCKLCSVAEQVLYNMLLTMDLMGNALLLGCPRETISKRTARARAAGSKSAAFFCRVLTFLGNLTGANRDHCTWAASEGPSIGGELWHWSQPDTSDIGNG